MDIKKEKYLEYQKQYREAHKSEIKARITEWGNKLVTCECCKNKVKKQSYAKHKKSKLCKDISSLSIGLI